MGLQILILLDLSAAFDTIDHKQLLQCLSSQFGFSELALKWFHSYISNRTQSVKINTSISQPKSLTYGVPQGSVLGPLLFIKQQCMTNLLYLVLKSFEINCPTYFQSIS